MPDAEPPRNHLAEGDEPPSSAPWEAMMDRVREATAPRYEVRRLLGYGGMAGVYLAEEPKLNRRVAIKVMAPSLMMDSSLVRRFRQEAQTIAGLNHPNIITIYDVAEGEDLHYFVMAYLPGRTVGHVMNEAGGPLPVDVIRAWLYQIGSALDYAHGFGIVHRDVKPGNLLLDDRGNAIVTDFGIAKVADREGLTRTGMLVGTPAYMSPEQCSSGEVGAPSDQYSLGAVAYQMLTGQTPFSGPTLQVLQAHVSQVPVPVREVRPDVPEEMAAAVDRMLAKAAGDRWPSLEKGLEAMGAAPVAQGAPVRSRLAELALPVKAIEIAPGDAGGEGTTELEAVQVGSTFVLSATARGPEGRVLRARAVRWRSEAPDVARVFPDGRVVTLRAGSTRITARCGGASSAVGVHVEGADVDAPAPVVREIPAGATVSLADVLPAQQPLSSEPGSGCSSSDPEIVRVSNRGEIEALRPGRATVTAFSRGRAVVAEFTVTPLPGGIAPPPRAAPAGSHDGATAPSGSTATTGSPTEDGPVKEGRPAKPSTVLVVSIALLAAVVAAGAGYFALAGGSSGAEGSSDAGGELAGPPPEEGGVESTEPGAGVADTAETVGGEPSPDTPEPDPEPAQPDAGAEPAQGPGREDVGDPEPDPVAPLSEGALRPMGLPEGSRITVAVGGGDRVVAVGDSVSLPPGSYRVRVEAPDFEPFEGRITVQADELLEWRPSLQASEAPPDEAEEPAQDTPDDPEVPAVPPEAEAEVRGMLQAFARSFGTRQMDEVLRFFPGAPGNWAERWRALVEDTENARDLQGGLRSMETPEFDGPDAAGVVFTIQLEYRDHRNTTQSPLLTFEAALERGESGWHFQELREAS